MKPWDEMTPRERDVLVATEVMGFDEIVLDDVKPYTTEIAAAWEVVELVESLDWSATVGTRVCLFSRDWVSDFGPKPTKFVSAREATVPESICVAALKALDPSLAKELKLN
jgi:hypothetical protein